MRIYVYIHIRTYIYIYIHTYTHILSYTITHILSGWLTGIPILMGNNCPRFEPVSINRRLNNKATEICLIDLNGLICANGANNYALIVNTMPQKFRFCKSPSLEGDKKTWDRAVIPGFHVKNGCIGSGSWRVFGDRPFVWRFP